MSVFRPGRLLAIIFGASEWPEFPGLEGTPAFVNSAKGFQGYLKDTVGVTDDNLLWLFDNAAGQTDIDKKIRAFLEERTKLIEPAEAGDSSRGDVFVFFTGHGRISQDGRFQFILRSTTKENVENSGYLMRHLALALDHRVLSFRRWVFLDCCFSGAAHGDLMPQAGDSAAAMRQEADSVLPPKGTALFAACGGNVVALAPRNQGLTMFSDALLNVLRMGDEQLEERMSLEEINVRVERLIQDTHAAEGVRPILSAPDQNKGNTAKLPIFPNPAKRGLENRRVAKEIQDRLDSIINEQARSAESLTNLAKSLRGQFKQLTQTLGRGVMSLEDCQHNFTKQLWDLSGPEVVEIRHLGLDLFKANEKMTAMLNHHFHVSKAALKVLVIDKKIKRPPPSVKIMTERVGPAVKAVVSALEDTIAPRYQEWGQRLDFEIRGYAEIPTLHGFSIRHGERHVASYFSFCRWKRAVNDIDWNQFGYREFLGDLDDDSLRDMVAVFDGAFTHLWQTGALVSKGIIGPRSNGARSTAIRHRSAKHT
jgi:hypothetical protein